MAGTYARRQLLLRKADGSSGGFVRMERVGESCAVAFHVSAPIDPARAVLVRPGDGDIHALGNLKRQGTSFTITAAEMEGCTQAAVVSGDAVLMVGGEGADFARIRGWLARAAEPPRSGMRAASGFGEKAHARAAERREVTLATSSGDAGGRESGDTRDTGDTGDTGEHLSARATAVAQDMGADHGETGGEGLDADHSAAGGAGLDADAPDGWEIVPFSSPGTPEQIEGYYRRDGKVVATLYGIAGVYAPEPPPGLDGFTWDNGYWVYVRE